MNINPKRGAITLIAMTLALNAITAIQVASAREPLAQYVCLIDNGPLVSQITLASAPTSLGMSSPCSPEGPVPLNPDGSPDLSSGTLANTGRVVFEHSATLLQYVCRFDSGPLVGQLALFSAPTPPAVGEACGDSTGNAGVVLYVEQ
jgi:hypothetical protein